MYQMYIAAVWTHRCFSSKLMNQPLKIKVLELRLLFINMLRSCTKRVPKFPKRPSFIKFAPRNFFLQQQKWKLRKILVILRHWNFSHLIHVQFKVILYIVKLMYRGQQMYIVQHTGRELITLQPRDLPTC